MHYIVTLIHPNGHESDQPYEAPHEKELRRRLEKQNLKIKAVRIDGSLEIADLTASLKIYSRFVAGLVVFLTGSFLFSFPFPFVRKIWFGEIWGYFGLLNILVFTIVARSLPKMSVAATFTGLILVLYEQALTWLGFYYLWLNGEVTRPALFFVIAAAVLSLGLIVIFWKAFSVTRIYYEVISSLRKEHRTFHTPEFSWQRYLVRFGLFLLYFLPPLIVLRLSPVINPDEKLAVMRLLGECACLTGAVGMGFEVERCFKNRAWSLHSVGIIFFHLAALSILTYWIYRQTPLQTVYLS